MPEIERKKASFFRDCSDKAVENAVTEIQGEREITYRIPEKITGFWGFLWLFFFCLGFFPFRLIAPSSLPRPKAASSFSAGLILLERVCAGSLYSLQTLLQPVTRGMF